jgi:hypothetical protein
MPGFRADEGVVRLIGLLCFHAEFAQTSPAPGTVLSFRRNFTNKWLTLFAGAAAKRLLTPFMRKGNHKFQNTKSQINSKFQKSKRLEFVPWNLEFICRLEFAVWNFAHRINIDNKLS